MFLFLSLDAAFCGTRISGRNVRTASGSDRIKTQLIEHLTFSWVSLDPVATARGSDTIAGNTCTTNFRP